MLVALHDLLCKLRLLCLRRVVIHEAVALLVCFGAEVYAILVAEVIPHRVVRIVACAHSVDVEALHEREVLYHALS